MLDKYKPVREGGIVMYSLGQDFGNKPCCPDCRDDHPGLTYSGYWLVAPGQTATCFFCATVARCDDV